MLSLKGNQGTLNEDVRRFLQAQIKKTNSKDVADRYKDLDKGHGRIGTRPCFVRDRIHWLSPKAEWAGLKNVVMIEKTQESNGEIGTESRFFLSSLPGDAKRIADAVRSQLVD